MLIPRLLPFYLLFVFMIQDSFSLSDKDQKWQDSVQQNYESLKDDLTKKIKLAKKNDGVIEFSDIYTLAVCHYYAGEYKRAQQISLSLTSVPDFRRKANYLAGLCEFQRHVGYEDYSPLTLNYLLKALKDDPDNPATWIALQTVYLASPRHLQNQFLKSFMKNIRKRYPGHFGYHILRGSQYQVSAQFSKAKKEFQEAYKKAPQNPATLNAILIYYRAKGDLPKSVVVLRELAKLNFDARYAAELVKEEAALKRLESFKDKNKSKSKSVLNELNYHLPFLSGTAIYYPAPADYSPQPMGHAHEGRGEFAFDFIVPMNTTICVARDGVLIKKEQTGTLKDSAEFRNYVMIDHGDGTFARYYNIRNTSCVIPVGSKVKAGQVLARSSRNYVTESSHIHFEVIEKAPWGPSMPYIYLTKKTVLIEFEEMKGLPENSVRNAWHISENFE